MDLHPWQRSLHSDEVMEELHSSLRSHMSKSWRSLTYSCITNDVNGQLHCNIQVSGEETHWMTYCWSCKRCCKGFGFRYNGSSYLCFDHFWSTLLNKYKMSQAQQQLQQPTKEVKGTKQEQQVAEQPQSKQQQSIKEVKAETKKEQHVQTTEQQQQLPHTLSIPQPQQQQGPQQLQEQQPHQEVQTATQQVKVPQELEAQTKKEQKVQTKDQAATIKETDLRYTNLYLKRSQAADFEYTLKKIDYMIRGQKDDEYLTCYCRIPQKHLCADIEIVCQAHKRWRIDDTWICSMCRKVCNHNLSCSLDLAFAPSLCWTHFKSVLSQQLSISQPEQQESSQQLPEEQAKKEVQAEKTQRMEVTQQPQQEQQEQLQQHPIVAKEAEIQSQQKSSSSIAIHNSSCEDPKATILTDLHAQAKELATNPLISKQQLHEYQTILQEIQQIQVETGNNYIILDILSVQLSVWLSKAGFLITTADKYRPQEDFLYIPFKIATAHDSDLHEKIVVFWPLPSSSPIM